MKERIIIIDTNIDLVELDLHNHTEYEIKTDLPKIMIEYYEQGYTHFKLIHGFHSGNVIQQYVRRKLKQDLLKEVQCKISLSPNTPGDTVVVFLVK